MDILSQIGFFAKTCPERTAFRNRDESLTYRELDLYSDRLAAFLARQKGENQAEIVVYGHKSPFMVISFLACIKAGLTYCPVDISMPPERIMDILAATEPPVLISTEPPLPEFLRTDGSVELLTLPRLKDITRNAAADTDPLVPLGPADICYIIFTSGSTGKPKGVQIPYGCLCSFTEWGLGLGSSAAQKTGKRFLNQAPFSFDLSVMDLYLSLAGGGTLCVLEKRIQENYRELFEVLKAYDPAVWVSTPSFAEVCLADPDFTGELLPSLEVFLFCGERLTNRTAEKLLQRFPGAKVMNTYGPTESTVAVTEVEITPKLLEMENPLPVGRVKPGSGLLIVDENGSPLPDGTAGEIVITGNTLAKGYYKSPALTEKAFRSCRPFPGADPVRGYHTGDEGYLKDGMLFYNGRIDLQIKMHGYRIELSDIENNLLRIPEVLQACVVPSERDGRVSALHGFVVLRERQEENDRKQGNLLKEKLSRLIPEYMVPKKFHFIPQIPMTANGKADRRRLKEMLG